MTTEYNISVLTEKVKTLEREVASLKDDVGRNKKSISEIQGEHRLIVYKLEEIGKDIAEVRGVLAKDSGWRGFFVDFIKAAAQIAALIGAGKFIF